MPRLAPVKTAARTTGKVPVACPIHHGLKTAVEELDIASAFAESLENVISDMKDAASTKEQPHQGFTIYHERAAEVCVRVERAKRLLRVALAALPSKK